LNLQKIKKISFATCGSHILKPGGSAGHIISGFIQSKVDSDTSLTTQSPDIILWIRRTLAEIPIYSYLLHQICSS